MPLQQSPLPKHHQVWFFLLKSSFFRTKTCYASFSNHALIEMCNKITTASLTVRDCAKVASHIASICWLPESKPDLDIILKRKMSAMFSTCVAPRRTTVSSYTFTTQKLLAMYFYANIVYSSSLLCIVKQHLWYSLWETIPRFLALTTVLYH